MTGQTETKDKALLQDMENRMMAPVIGQIFMYLARPALEQLGMDGEMAVRKGLRGFGNYRGQRIKRWHEKEGLPLNLESLLKFWDIISISGCGADNPEAVFTPYYSEFTTTNCPLADVALEAGWSHWAYLYCDEMHYECYKAYHPKAVVEIHENLNKGDSGCHFLQWMPEEIPEDQIDKSPMEALTKRVQENPIEFARLMLSREGNFVGMISHFLAKALIEKFDQKGKAMVESSMIELGKQRGRDLKARLDKAGVETTWENIWDKFDLTYKYAWKMNREEAGDDRSFIAEVEYCPLAEVWSELDDTAIGPVYCDNPQLTTRGFR